MYAISAVVVVRHFFVHIEDDGYNFLTVSPMVWFISFLLFTLLLCCRLVYLFLLSNNDFKENERETPMVYYSLMLYICC